LPLARLIEESLKTVPMLVLVVDDDPVLRRATVRALPRFQVDAVARADEALSAIERSEYQALVVDACLGPHNDRSGAELVRSVRDRGVGCGIVLISGVVEDDLDGYAQRLGADVALQKAEFDGPTLRAAIERAIAARSPPAGEVDETELSEELQALVGDVLDTIASERALEAEQAYRLALLAKAALASTTPRGSPIEACARAVGLSRQTLQPYALVASRWSAPELKRLLAERRNVRGEPISISHLVMLAKLPRATRDSWIERVFSEGLTVRQLRDILKTEPKVEGKD
jgi:DNA-binding response OmpR family regulator